MGGMTPLILSFFSSLNITGIDLSKTYILSRKIAIMKLILSKPIFSIVMINEALF
jgi:uncharacterized protein with ParB-like and HNH nuclease domain